MNPGDIVTVVQKAPKGYKTKELEFVSESSHTFRFTNGKYIETMNKADIKAGDVIILMEEDRMKISEEQLLNECRILGVQKAARVEIAKKYGLTPGTLDFYFYQWGIKKRIDAETAETRQSEETKSKDIYTEKVDKEIIKENAENVINAMAEQQEDIKIDKPITEEKNYLVKTFIPEPKEEEEPSKIKFWPVLLKADTFTYRFAAGGLSIEAGVSDVITQECINEQQEALKIWQQYYGGIEDGRA